jgi:hypothetical protein
VKSVISFLCFYFPPTSLWRTPIHVFIQSMVGRRTSAKWYFVAGRHDTSRISVRIHLGLNLMTGYSGMRSVFSLYLLFSRLFWISLIQD